MLIKDSEVILEHKEREIVERTRQQTRDAIDERVKGESLSTGMDAGMDMTDPDQRWGRKMHVNSVVRMLHEMNPNLVFEVSKHLSTLMGIYIPEWELDAATLGWHYNKRYIMAMENDMMPEFTIVYADQIELPNEDGTTRRIKQYTAMKRGWRAVLVTLLWEKLITEDQIARYFNVSQGQESRIWQQETGQAQRITIINGGEGKDYGDQHERQESESESRSGITGTAGATGIDYSDD